MQKEESGQALVLVLLSLSVVLTLVLFILSRSVTDVAVSSTQEQSVRAFSAAEAGIERSLVVGESYGNFENNASYTTTITGFADGSTDLPFPSPVSYGDTVTVWFVSHDPSGNLICSLPDYPCFHGDTPSIKVCWGNLGMAYPDQNEKPAIELSVYYKTPAGDAAHVQIGRTALDPFVGRPGGNSFDTADGGTCSIGTQTYAFQKTINFSDLKITSDSYGAEDGLQLAQIRMLYNLNASHLVGVSVSGGTLPSQGQKIDSSGVAGGSNRRIVVLQSWPGFPFASNSILVPSGITK